MKKRNCCAFLVVLVAIYLGLTLFTRVEFTKEESFAIKQKYKNHQIIWFGDITLNIHVFGEIKNTSDIIIALHGFPETGLVAYRKLIAHMTPNLTWIVPDLRGFNFSGKANSSSGYSIPNAANDVELIVKHFNLQKHKNLFLIGHDSGGLVAWVMTERESINHFFKKIFIINVPHSRVYDKYMNLDQLWRSKYALLLGIPPFKYLKYLLEFNDYAFIDNVGLVGSKFSAQDQIDLHQSWKISMDSMVQWYTALLFHKHNMGNITNTNIHVIWGTNDFAFRDEMISSACDFVVDGVCTVTEINNGGHFVIHNKPIVVAITITTALDIY